MSKANFPARLVLAAIIAGLGAVAHAGTVTLTQNSSTLATCTFTTNSATFSGATGNIDITCDPTGGGGSGSLTLSAAGTLYEGTSAKTITLTRPNGTGAATAEVTISGGALTTDFTLGASAPNTVTGSVVTLLFADGVTTSAFTLIPRSRNGVTNSPVSLTLGITNPGSYTAGAAQTATIADSTLNLTPASQTLIAGGATGTVTVTRTPGVVGVGASTITLTASGGTPGTDYTFSGGTNVTAAAGTVTLSFADGVAAIPVTVTPVTAASTLNVSLTPTLTDNYTPGSAVGITINPAGSSTCVKTGGTAWTNFSRPGLSTQGALSGGATQAKVTYSFTLPSTMPKGAIVYFNNSSSGAYAPRDHFISECVGEFTQAPGSNNPENCKAFNSMTGQITLGRTDNAASMDSSTCNLEYGKTYYLNIRTIASGGVYQNTGYLLDTEKRY